MRNWFASTSVKMMVLVAGCTAALTPGCYPEYEEEIIGSFNAATNVVTTTFIDAFFESLKPEEPVSLGSV
jgi:hypothetical protein